MQLDRRSALRSALPTKRPVSPDTGKAACRLGEAPDFSLVQVAGWGVDPGAVDAALASALGAAMPGSVGQTVRHGNLRIMRTAPNQIWIFARRNDDPAERLAAAIGGETGCVTSLSQSRTRIFIHGAQARHVLAKGLAVDLHESVFAVDAFALTALHHVPVLVHREAADRFEVTVLRTFALTIWEWLADAAREFNPEFEVADLAAAASN